MKGLQSQGVPEANTGSTKFRTQKRKKKVEITAVY